MKKYYLSILFLLPAIGFSSHELVNRNFESGKQLYLQHCSSCHGKNLEGEAYWRTPKPDGILPAPPHDETGHTWHHNNQFLFNYTKYGGLATFEALGVTDIKSGMEGFGNVLEDSDIWDILGYIRSTWPASIQRIQDDRNPPH